MLKKILFFALAVLLLFFVYNYSGIHFDLFVKNIPEEIDTDEAELLTERQTEEIDREIGSIIDQYNAEAGPEIRTSSARADIQKPEAPSGTIVMSSKETVYDPLRIYSFDVADKTPLFREKLEDVLPDTPIGFVHFVGNSADASEAFIAVLPDGSNTGTSEGVYTLDTNSLTKRKLTSVQGDLYRNFDYSLTQELLAVNNTPLNTGNYSDTLRIANWNIEIIDPTADEQKLMIKEAWSPRWIEDTPYLLFMKENGLFAYNFDTEETSTLAEISGGIIVATSMFDVSPDGQYIVWTTAKDGIISILGVTQDENGIGAYGIDQIVTTGTEYYWPTFSFDSTHFAVQAISSFDVETNARNNPRLQIRSLAEDDVVREIPLDVFNFNSLFMDGWLQSN